MLISWCPISAVSTGSEIQDFRIDSALDEGKTRSLDVICRSAAVKRTGETAIADWTELIRVVDDPFDGIGERIGCHTIQNDISDKPLADHILIPGLGMNERREKHQVIANILITGVNYVILL